MAKSNDKLHIALNKYKILKDFKAAQDMDYVHHLLETWHYYQYLGYWHTICILRIEIIESELVGELLKHQK